MNYKVLAFCIALAIFLMGSVLFFVVSQGAKQTQQEVLAQQAEFSLTNPTVTRGLFTTTAPNYAFEHRLCSEPPFVQEAYINLVLRYRQTPRSCTFWVNDRYVQTVRDLAPSCIHECPVGEFSRTIPLGEHDIRDSHTVRICCNDICIEQTLRRGCEIS